MNPWICPKCGRVWGPFVAECVPCNKTPSAERTITVFSENDCIHPKSRVWQHLDSWSCNKCGEVRRGIYDNWLNGEAQVRLR